MIDHAAYEAAERQRDEESQALAFLPRLDHRTLAETYADARRAPRCAEPAPFIRQTDERWS